MTWQEYSYGEGVAFGIEWNEVDTSATQYKITPEVWRWDSQTTDNYGSSLTETLKPEPSGSTGYWEGIVYGSGSGWRCIDDTYSTRTYSKTHSTQTIKLTLSTDVSFGTWLGSFVTYGEKSHTFSLTIPAKTSYTVKYDANGGSGAPASQTKWHGETLTISSTTPTRSGYSFKRWKSTRSDGTYYFNPGGTTTYNGSQTLVAEWEVSTRTVTYDGNGATSGSTASQTANIGTAITIKSNGFSRTGYTFSTWNTKADGTGTNYSAGYSYTGSSSLKLYAKWTANTYTVSYNGNGSTSGSTSSQTKTYGVNLTLRSNGYTKTGHTFQKWNTNSSGTGTSYNAGAPYSKNEPATLYAIWKANTYTVSYNANGGSGTTSSQTKTHGTDITLRANGFTRTNYVFRYWYTNSSGSGGTSYEAGAPFSTDADTTLYAIWRAPYAVTYYANGGSGAPAAGTKVYGKTYTISSTKPTRSGYVFQKWNTNSSGTGTPYNPGGSYSIDANLTLYAIWETEHAAPTVTGFKVQRCLSDGTLDDVGTYVKVTANWSVDRSTSGYTSTTGKNAKITLDGTTDTITLSGASGSISAVHSKTVAVTASKMVTLSVTDSADYSTSKQLTVGVAFFTMHFKSGGRAVGIGRLATSNDSLQVGVDAYFDGLLRTYGSHYIRSESFDSTAADNGLVEDWSKGYYFTDKNGNGAVRFGCEATTTGDVSARMYAQRKTGDNWVLNALRLKVNGDGTRTVVVSESAPWRNALGASNGVWQASQGGTGESTLRSSANALINALTAATGNITNDDTYIITQNTNATEQAYYRRPVSKLWAYIKSKIDSTYGIGTVKSKYDTASATSATSKEVASLSLEAGTWVVTATVLFYSSATGYRNVKLSTTSGDTSVSSYYSVTSPAASGAATILSRSVIVQPSETTTYYLNAYQNSGSSLTCEAQIKAVRIA